MNAYWIALACLAVVVIAFLAGAIVGFTLGEMSEENAQRERNPQTGE